MKHIALLLCLLSVSPVLAKGWRWKRNYSNQKNKTYTTNRHHYSTSGQRVYSSSPQYYGSGSGQSAQLLSQINSYRAQHGLRPLTYDPRLNMNDGPGHGNWKRSGMSGVTNWAGSSSASGAFSQWRNSSGHNRNMLNPNISRVGFGFGNGTTMVAQ